MFHRISSKQEKKKEKEKNDTSSNKNVGDPKKKREKKKNQTRVYSERVKERGYVVYLFSMFRPVCLYFIGDDDSGINFFHFDLI